MTRHMSNRARVAEFIALGMGSSTLAATFGVPVATAERWMREYESMGRRAFARMGPLDGPKLTAAERRAASSDLQERNYWVGCGEFWESDGPGRIAFRPDTPQRVIDSYNLWSS